MQTIEAIWTGPYSWPNFEPENGLPPLLKGAGLYLQTVEYADGYAIYAAGLTRRTIAQRMREHTRKYMTGDYNVLDLGKMQHGVRHEVWHGWGWTPEKRAHFESKKEMVAAAARTQMAGFRLFVADIGTEPRLLERLEAAIMSGLYQQSAPFCDLPDKGMMLAPRRAEEEIIEVGNQCDVIIYCLPDRLKI